MERAGTTIGQDGAITGTAGEELNLECVSEGGNPAPKLFWSINGRELPTLQAQENQRTEAGAWKAVSRLTLPVSRADHRAEVRCRAEHDALDADLTTARSLEIYYPPRVTASSTAGDQVLAEGQQVVFSCSADSNPPASLTWRRVGGSQLTTEASFTIQSVGRETAGRYECVGENFLGLSKPAAVEIQVQCK